MAIRWSLRSAAPVPIPDAIPAPDDTAEPTPRCLLWQGLLANRGELEKRFSLPHNLTEPQTLLELYRKPALAEAAAVARQLTGTACWVLWDPPRRLLLAGRDRAGAHALYYREQGESLLLAGRLEDLLEEEAGGKPPVNPRAVAAHLEGAPPPPGETFFEGIRVLEPGSVLQVAAGRPRTERYWQLSPGPVLRGRSDQEFEEVFRGLLLEVVAESLPPAGDDGEKAVAVTLSAGLDSASIAAAARRLRPELALVALRWIAPELPEADEDAYSRLTSNHLGCTDVVLRADRHWTLSEDLVQQTPRSGPLISAFEPLWEATFREAASRGVSVLLAGGGGDHLFGGGISTYPDWLFTLRWRRLARELTEHRGRSTKTVPQLVRDVLLPQLLRAWRPASRSSVPWWRRGLLPSRRLRLELLAEPQLAPQLEYHTRRAAEYGLSLRNPLMDHRLFELAARMPAAQSYRAGLDKVVVRRALRGLLPAKVLELPGKIYPTRIFERGVREREQARVWNLLTGMRAAELGFVDEGRLRRSYQDYLDGRDRTAFFWYTLTLEAWLRKILG